MAVDRGRNVGVLGRGVSGKPGEDDGGGTHDC